MMANITIGAHAVIINVMIEGSLDILKNIGTLNPSVSNLENDGDGKKMVCHKGISLHYLE